MQCPQEENYSLMRNTPGQLIQDAYAMAPYEDFKRGYKNPVDLFYPGTSLKYLGQYFPKTKLLVTLRHPVRYVSSACTRPWYSMVYGVPMARFLSSQLFLFYHSSSHFITSESKTTTKATGTDRISPLRSNELAHALDSRAMVVQNTLILAYGSTGLEKRYRYQKLRCNEPFLRHSQREPKNSGRLNPCKTQSS